MKNENNDPNKILLGIVIGGLAGGTAFYLWSRSHDRNKPLLDKIGRAICDVGEILEDSCVDNRKEAIAEIEKAIPKEDNTVNHILSWVATGIHLWKKMKKG